MGVNLAKTKKEIRKYFPFLVRPYQLLRETSKFLKYGFADISKVGLIGNSVGLEACSICQLKCPLCPTAKDLNRETIGRGYLRLEKLKEFANRNPMIKHFEFANWGEIFLNPEIKEIIRFGHERHLVLTATCGVNLNTVKDDVLECLVKYGFRVLTISIDGASNETYPIYRRRGNFTTVIRNIEKINYFKKKYASEYPLLRWQFVIMGHNEHELPVARKKALELGMKFVPKLNVDSSFSPIQDEGFVRRESGLGVASREEFRKRKRRAYTLTCYQFWHLPRVNWDGKLLGCCTNIWGDFGNVFDSGFKKGLLSERFVYAKRMLLGKEKQRDDIPCSKCYIYKAIQKEPLRKLDIIRGRGYRTSSDLSSGDWSGDNEN